jgi:hypothetical protein
MSTAVIKTSRNRAHALTRRRVQGGSPLQPRQFRFTSAFRFITNAGVA